MLLRVLSKPRVCLCLLVAVVAAVPPGWQASQVKLEAPDKKAGDWFGSDVAAYKNLIVVGAARYDSVEFGTNAGAVYLFQRAEPGAELDFITKLEPSAGQSESNFGTAVAIDGNRIVAGAPYTSEDDGPSGVGAVYVFLHDESSGTWAQEAMLQPSDREEDMNFGISVLVSGDIVVGGAHRDNRVTLGGGAVYIFEPDTGGWSEQVIVSPLGMDSGWFGASLAYRDPFLVVGAEETAPNRRGAIHVFDRTTSWSTLDTLMSSDNVDYDRFGNAVDITENGIIVAGAFINDNAASEGGQVYVFSETSVGSKSWSEVDNFNAIDTTFGDRFGFSCKFLDGNTMIVGAISKAAGPNSDIWNAGAAYEMQLDPVTGYWEQIDLMYAAEPSELDNFGWSVAVMDDRTILLGVHKDDGGPGDPSSDQGAVYLMNKHACPRNHYVRQSDGECIKCPDDAASSMLSSECRCANGRTSSKKFGCAIVLDSLLVILLIVNGVFLTVITVAFVAARRRRSEQLELDTKSSIMPKKPRAALINTVDAVHRPGNGINNRASAMTAVTLDAPRARAPSSGKRGRSRTGSSSGSHGRRGRTKRSHGKVADSATGYSATPVQQYGTLDDDDARSVHTVTSEMAPFLPDRD